MTTFTTSKQVRAAANARMAEDAQIARIAELEAALRYIQTRTGTDAAIQAHIAAALAK